MKFKKIKVAKVNRGSLILHLGIPVLKDFPLFFECDVEIKNIKERKKQGESK